MIIIGAMGTNGTFRLLVASLLLAMATVVFDDSSVTQIETLQWP
jgi:hypothetical protein